MPKRTAEEKITLYREKIRKLEEKKQKHRRRVIIYSDSSDSEENESQIKNHETVHTPPVSDTPDDVILDEPSTGVVPTTQASETLPASPAAAETTASVPSGSDVAHVTTVPDTDMDLDPEILSALGAKPEDDLEYGSQIHDNLSQLWLPLLKKGMAKEEKDKLLKNYLVPDNCRLLQAPKLNLEIAAAITESARGRDKKLASAQQQLGMGITAVNRALDSLISKEENCTMKAIKHLSDACRVLCDLHHTESQARIKLITPNLDKNFLNIIQDSHRDETLFGIKLAEKIKSSKTIEKQGLQIKKATTPCSLPSTSNSRPNQARGNWTGPSRYTSNKSGRGTGKKTAQSSRKPPPPPPAAKQSSKQTRAPTQQ